MNAEHAKRLNEQDHKTLALWAADCAEHVLPHFEDKYPEDNRPREALNAGRAWVRGELAVSKARDAAFAAHAAARDADHDAARAAARAAGHAAATAHVADRAGTPVITVVRSDKAYEIEVTLGVETREYAQVTRGLSAGDLVVTEGGYGLPDGCPVRILPERPSTRP